MKPRIIIYFKKQQLKDKFIYGDKYVLPFIKRLVKGKKTSGVEKVFFNLCQSFNLLGIEYSVNLPFNKLQPNDRIIVLGLGKFSLEGYNKKNKIIAGIALMTHPSEWPNLCNEYPIAKYLQHSSWAKNVYVPYYGKDICDSWFAGIDSKLWKPKHVEKKIDILIYNKIRWNYKSLDENLRSPIIQILNRKKLSYKEIIYGDYKEKDYRSLLNDCKAMIFLCEHESQGFACCEALSMNIPIFAWDQGYCLDPNRFSWDDPIISSTSVPFFDEKCGAKFKDFIEFERDFGEFYSKIENEDYNPRKYILENLTLEKSGKRMLEIIKSVYS